MLEQITCALCGTTFEGIADDVPSICPLHRNLLGQGHFAFVAPNGTCALVRRELLPKLGFNFDDDVFAMGCSPEVVLQLQGIATSLAAQHHHKVH